MKISLNIQILKKVAKSYFIWSVLGALPENSPLQRSRRSLAEITHAGEISEKVWRGSYFGEDGIFEVLYQTIFSPLCVVFPFLWGYKDGKPWVNSPWGIGVKSVLSFGHHHKPCCCHYHSPLSLSYFFHQNQDHKQWLQYFSDTLQTNKFYYKNWENVELMNYWICYAILHVFFRFLENHTCLGSNNLNFGCFHDKG